MSNLKIEELIDTIDNEVQYVAHECYDPYEYTVTLSDTKKMVKSLTVALRAAKSLQVIMKKVKEYPIDDIDDETN